MTIRIVSANDISVRELYEVWRIRDSVFSVEQNCREEDVDGIDLRDDCVHFWIADEAGHVRSYARVFREDGITRLGRVATRRSDRGQKLSTQIINRVISEYGSGPIAIHAQAYLEEWYSAFGFITNGPHFVEADIDHVPMLRLS